MIACDVEEGQQLRLLHGTVMQARKFGGRERGGVGSEGWGEEWPQKANMCSRYV